jgi:hypothetical protein
MSEDTTDDEEAQHGRRKVILGLGAATVGAAFSVGRASAQSSPEGEIGTPSNPYRVAYVDRVSYVGRTSDPSSPGNGTSWYREDL